MSNRSSATSALAGRPVVVFDLDGTIVDSAPDLVATLNIILDREGLPPVPFSDARRLIGGGSRKLLERGMALEGHQATAAVLDRLVADFIEHYAENIAVHSQPFDGLFEALDVLEASGFAFAICSNKLEWLSIRLLDALALTSRFAIVCGPDTFGAAKPNPEGLRQTIIKAGGRLPRAVMVGDSYPDIGAARAAGIPVVGVDFGYTDVPVAELKPDAIVSHLRDLPGEVLSLWQSMDA